jgi:hypothetical protein
VNYKQVYAIKRKNEAEIKKLCPDAEHKSGIYCFHRTDENDFKYAYVGQATKSVLTRCAEHLSGYTQHIDRSIKKHKLYREDNPCGWKLSILCYCSEDECNEKEQYYIKQAHQSGRQLLNVTGGSQGEGKFNIAENKPSKGYYDGIKQGYKKAQKEIAHLFKLHLVCGTKKVPPTKLQEKAMQKFECFIDVEEEKEN